MSEPDVGTLLGTFSPHTNRVSCVAISPDSDWIASGSFDGRVLLWRADGGQLFGGIAMPRGDRSRPLEVTALAVAQTVKILAIGGEDGAIRLWQTDTWQPKAVCQGHTRQVAALAFSPAGDRLLSCSFDGSVLMVRTADGSIERRIAKFETLCRSAAISPDGKAVAIGTDDGAVYIFDAAGGALLREIEAHSASVAGLAFIGTGDHLVSGSWDGSVKWWDVNSGTRFAEHTRHSDSGRVTSVAAGVGVIASGSEDGTVDIADTSSAQRVALLTDNAYWVHCIAASHDKSLVVAGAQDAAVRVWDYSSSKLIWSSLNSAKAPQEKRASHRPSKTTPAVDPADLYREGYIVDASYSFKGVSLLSIQPKGRGTPKAIDISAEQSPSRAASKRTRQSKTLNPLVEIAVGKLARLRSDREVTVIVTTDNGILEEGRVEGTWEGREYSLGYRVHWQPGMLETDGMCVQDIVELLGKRDLAEMEGEDFFGLSAHELRDGQAEYMKPKWKKARVRSS